MRSSLERCNILNSLIQLVMRQIRLGAALLYEVRRYAPILPRRQDAGSFAVQLSQ